MTHLALALALATLAQAPAGAPSPPALLSALETALADAVAGAEPSVVAIAREKSGDGQGTTAVRGREPAAAGAPPVNAFEDLDPGGDFQSTDYGSGVVIGAKGEILTAFHVVRGASRLRVRAAGRQQFDAEVLAADPRSDLAVIAPKATPTGRGLPRLAAIPLGDASKLRKGSFLLALGNPFNAARDGQASASWGILANVARRIDPPLEDGPVPKRQLRHSPTLLQLDAKLNLGMSGGAVVNLKGELVGVTTTGGDPAGFDAQAGYAVPLDALGRRIVETLRQGKEVEYGFIGVKLDNRESNRIAAAVPGTPAAQGGLLARDAIVEVAGLPIRDNDDLILALSSQPVGEPIRLKVERHGDLLDKTVVLSKFPVVGEVIATNRPAPWRGLRVDFTSIISGEIHGNAILEAMTKGGVGVVDVEPGSPAEGAGLKNGQVITAVEGKPVRTPAAFAEAVARARGPVTLDTDLGSVTVK